MPPRDPDDDGEDGKEESQISQRQQQRWRIASFHARAVDNEVGQRVEREQKN
jgi:hypothetical protein